MPASPETLILQSPDGRYFRRLHPDGRIERKVLGLDWHPADPPQLVVSRDIYLDTMTRRLGWKPTTETAGS